MSDEEMPVEWDEEKLDRIIYILGACSSAFDAKEDLKRRRAAGEDARVWYDPRRHMFIVGPRP